MTLILISTSWRLIIDKLRPAYLCAREMDGIYDFNGLVG